MDLVKIGKYIAGKRKGLGMTQKQVAEKLGMSDKSVSKWERGICLPDVAVYSDLCAILGISIHAFLAGEDIPQESILQKTEENIIRIATDNKKKQRRLKTIICVLLIISVLAMSVIGSTVYQKCKPQNFITPLPRDSIEMETAALFSGPDGAYIYKFKATDTYRRFKLNITEFHAGALVNKETMELDFDGLDTPEEGRILIVPDFKNFVVQIVIAAEGAKYATELPILEGISDKLSYGRSATEIQESTPITYNKEQPLLALLYDSDRMRVIDLYALANGSVDSISENDYIYFFSFEFCK